MPDTTMMSFLEAPIDLDNVLVGVLVAIAIMLLSMKWTFRDGWGGGW